MDQTNTTTVSGGAPGVSVNGMPQTQNTGDAGGDLDERLRQRIEEIANGFRSTIDRRFAPFERVDWAPQFYAQDPDGWASTVIANASTRYAEELNQNQEMQAAQAVEQQRRRALEMQQRRQMEAQNAQRFVQANSLETQVPSGPQANWREKVAQMDPEQRRRWMDRMQKAIVHGEVSHVNQFRV